MHDPERADERAKARKIGGYNRRTAHAGDTSALPKKVRSLEEVLEILDYTLIETAALNNSVIRTRALVILCEAYAHALEAGDVEKRLAALEEVINAQSKTKS